MRATPSPSDGRDEQEDLAQRYRKQVRVGEVQNNY